MHSQGIFRWMGTLTKVTLISDVLEVMTLYVREQVSLEQCLIVTIFTTPGNASHVIGSFNHLGLYL